MTVSERFLNYVRMETMSDEDSVSTPSTSCQLDLGRRLVGELLELGLLDANMDENGYVMATLPKNTDANVPVIGFIAHMDTAPDLSTRDITPRIVKNYDGSTIALNNSVALSPVDFPFLNKYVGNDLIVTDGNTLLGADDKAGIAEIMTVLETLTKNPSIAHGTIKIAFTPDEEIGRGADHFDVAKFGAQYAYTVDGGELGELEFESFNAANIKLTVHGRNVHPGYAKNRMINSMEIAQELHAMLPREQKPQFTQGYEGFFHQTHIQGTVDETKAAYILRDHDHVLFEEKKRLFRSIVDFINLKYGKNTVELIMDDRYYNMGEKIKPVFFIVEIAKDAMKELGIEPIVKPIRGGTDGSRLSYMGLPCPNIFTGGHNFHGRHEFISIQSMEKAVLTVLKIIEKFSVFEPHS